MVKVFNDQNINNLNPYKSPFQHVFWIYLILTTAAVSLVIVTVNNIITIVHYFQS